MSKELEALEEFVKLNYKCDNCYEDELINIIKKALKDYEELKIAHKKYVKVVEETNAFYSNELRALDVIKKGLGLEFEFREQEYPFDNYLIIVRSGYEHIVIGMPKNKASKIRYDLLKEVLL